MIFVISLCVGILFKELNISFLEFGLSTTFICSLENVSFRLCKVCPFSPIVPNFWRGWYLMCTKMQNILAMNAPKYAYHCHKFLGCDLDWLGRCRFGTCTTIGDTSPRNVIGGYLGHYWLNYAEQCSICSFSHIISLRSVSQCQLSNDSYLSKLLIGLVR